MIRRVFDGLAAIAGAVSFAQFPAFFQQYLQRLGGMLDQARLDVARLMKDAAAEGQSLEAYLADLEGAGNVAARQAAQRELDRVGHVDDLESAYTSLSLAEALERPLFFVRHLDAQIAEETFKTFQPAFPVTVEALVYAGTGMMLALFILAGIEAAGRSMVDMVRSA